MVRRGSTVRVRQRALQKPRKTGLLLSCTCSISSVRWVWSPLWSLQIENLVLKCAWPHAVGATNLPIRERASAFALKTHGGLRVGSREALARARAASAVHAAIPAALTGLSPASSSSWLDR